LFFGEGPSDRDYKLPEAIAAAKVVAVAGNEKPSELKMNPVKEEGFIGLRSTDRAPKKALLTSTCEYGLYHGMLLTYYAKRLPGLERTSSPAEGRKAELPFDVTAALGDGQIDVGVRWQGKPRAGAEVTLLDSSGDSQEVKTDLQGKAAFKHVAKGIVGVTANYLEDRKGEVGGKPFTSAYYCSTLTFSYGERPAAKHSSPDKSSLPDLPEPLASFGAAVNNGWLHVYGGHIGEEHEHSKANLSSHFRRIEFVAGAQWEELPMQTPLQGLPLVSFGDKVYRVGGLSARNASDEKEDLHSVAEAAAFDTKSKTWTELPPLPEPRSSHDAVVIGNMLYVVGGWTLNGSSKGTWLDTAWSLDLSKGDAKWEPVISPGFHRRALALGEWNGQLVAMGGIDENRKVSRRADALDIKAGQWRQIAELPGEGIDGFGLSACTLNGKLYVSGTQECLYRLANDGKSWEKAAKLTEPRFFHRMTPGRSGKLLLVGGATESGHVADIEEIEPERRPALEE
jgi:hypothetical protein